MAGEIAQAFVRVRPNMHGFKSEVESGARTGFSGIAKIAGIAFGAHEAFKFGQEIVGHAADVQKQVQAIGNEFGKSGDQIIKFGEHAATGLGISEHLAVRTGARFGILFKNLGIGQSAAAQMTVGFEKLAGSLSAIRNVDPALTLQNLPLAVAGNLRSLKQLGIATDQTQLKLAAYKLGLISSIKEGLTPQTRAIAIYSIATAHLADFQAQAAAHSGDLVNKQRRLRAEWDNSKDALGRGLLPVMAALTGFLAERLPGALAGVHHGFTVLQNDARAVTAPVGGLKTAVLGLTAAFVISKVLAYGKALTANLVARGRAVKAAATGAAAEVGAQEAVTASTLELVGALRGLTTAFETAGIAGTTSMRVVQGSVNTVQGSIIGLKAQVATVGPAMATAAVEGEAATGALTASLIGLRAVIIGVLGATGIGLILVALGLAATYVITHWEKVKAWFLNFARVLPRLLNWKVVGDLARDAAYGIVYYFTFAIQKVLEVASHLPFVGKYAKKASAAIKDVLNEIKPDNSSLSAAWEAAGGRDGKRYADAFINTASQATKGLKLGTLPALSLLTGKTVNDKITATVLQKPKTEIKVASDAVKGALDDLFQHYQKVVAANDAGVTKIRGQLTTLNTSLKDALTQQEKDINDAVGQAKGNLLSVASSLSQAVGAILDKPIQDAQDKITRASNLQNLSAIRASVLLPGGKRLSADPKKALAELEALAKKSGNVNKAAIQGFITQYRSAVLTVRQDKVNVLKQHVTQNLQDLASDFATGKITQKQFDKGVVAQLKGAGASYKRAGQLLGSAFATGFHENAKGLLLQGAAIASGPQRVGQSGQNVTIIKPLDAITQSNKDIAKITHQIGAKQTALQTRIAANTKKQADLLAKVHDLQLGKVPTINKSKDNNPGRAGKQSTHLNGTTH